MLTLTTAVSLKHFRLLRVVGRGSFGKVRLVKRKDTNLYFALKYIRKDNGMPSTCTYICPTRSPRLLSHASRLDSIPSLCLKATSPRLRKLFSPTLTAMP
jgi:serine/threonine protein kinase